MLLYKIVRSVMNLTNIPYDIQLVILSIYQEETKKIYQNKKNLICQLNLQFDDYWDMFEEIIQEHNDIILNVEDYVYTRCHKPYDHMIQYMSDYEI